MKFIYRVSRLAPLYVAGRLVNNLPLDSDGFRIMELEQTEAEPLLKSGLLVEGSGTPSLPSVTDVTAGDFDFKGSILRNGRAKTNRYTENRTIDVTDKGCFVEINSASNVTVTLPADWKENEGCEIVREGTGDVLWAPATGASVRLPSSMTGNIRISERYGSIRARVIKNPDGASAVWEIKGATS